MFWAIMLAFNFTQLSFADNYDSQAGCGTVIESPDNGQIDDLVDLVKAKGRRERIVLNERPDLKILSKLSECLSKKRDESCEFRKLNELRLPNFYGESVVAFEAIVVCQDSPSPAVGVYFDVSKRYLKSIQFGN